MARRPVSFSSASRSSGGAHHAMPQLADIARGTGISLPGRLSSRHAFSMVIAAVAVGNPAISRRDFSLRGALTDE